ncbi:MAG: hypothetical protein IJ727_13070 [Treponema sp.]|nr:hypothetical protein [Treponema sp.]
MKNALKKIPLFWLFACTFCLIFVSCKKDDDDDVKTVVKAELPASVGMNDFEGKTWKNDELTWSFTSSTATEIEVNEVYGGQSETSNYSYSYDSEKKLLYLSLVSFEFGDTTVSSEAEYVERMKKEREDSGLEFNARDMVEAKSDAKDMFEILQIYEYSIDSDGSLTLKEYFSGSLPTFIQFREDDDPSSSSFTNLRLEGSTLKMETSDNSKTYIFLNYSKGSFSGTAVTEGTILEPTATGTYIVSGAGISDSIVTLKFTALPTKITEISNLRTNTEYQLKQVSPNETSETLYLSN